jgi:hypothetical protein
VRIQQNINSASGHPAPTSFLVSPAVKGFVRYEIKAVTCEGIANEWSTNDNAKSTY